VPGNIKKRKGIPLLIYINRKVQNGRAIILCPTIKISELLLALQRPMQPNSISTLEDAASI
jgi:hypothetical protein